MEISLLGHSSFLLKIKAAKLVTDPFGKAPGFLQVKSEADVVTISHNHHDHDDLSQISGTPVVIDGPGEYEVKGFSITGLASWHDDQGGKLRGANTVYLIEAEDMKLVHLGDQGTALNESQLAVLEGVDILFVPVGGVFSLDAQAAWKVVQSLSPRLIIPMHYQTKEHNRDFGKLATVDDFIKTVGLEPRKETKLVVSKLILPEETELVILERKS
ncbi:MAG: MBL fold metallo-hydrolase [Candidatus Beckwithbacteria bacterium]|nr:MBL fold metallo-hydrolase [Candidatus Beckwithbacteria bacterium]